MASDYSALLRAVHVGTTRALETSEQVAAVVDAARQLASVHHRRLPTQWELPKLLSATLRVQLNARVTASASVAGVGTHALCDMLATAWQLCPIPSLPSPLVPCIAESGRGSAASAVSLLPLSESRAARVAQELAALEDTPRASALTSELRQPTVVPSVRDTAVAVVTSLLLYWQALADRDGSDFVDVSLTVWRCVHSWTDFDGVAGATLRSTLHVAWLATVLRYALRESGGGGSGGASCMHDAVDLLEAVARRDCGESAVPTLSTVPSAAVQAMWAELHLRACRHAVADLKTRQAALHAAWRRTVAPALKRAFATEPARLSPSFAAPIAFQEPLEDELRELRRVADSEGASSDEAAHNDGLALLLRLAPLSAWLGDAVGLRVVPFLTATTYSTHLAPIVVTVLRWGRTADARTLLDGAAAALDTHGAQWRQRLHSALAPHDGVRGAALTSSCTVGDGGLPYREWLSGLQCTAAAALDVLAGSDGVHQLRPVCDALLLVRPQGQAAPWVGEVLRDPCTPALLLAGLGRLIERLLHHRDAPQARFYVTLMGQLLPRCPCPAQLRVLLGLVHRLATALTTTHLAPADFASPSSRHPTALAVWRRLKAALEAAGGADGACEASPLQCLASSGLAWVERHRLHERFAGHDDTEDSTNAASAPASGLSSVVELTYAPTSAATAAATASEEAAATRGLLWVRRSVGGERGASSITVCCEVGGALCSCAAAMADVMARNRAQLLRGSTVAVPVDAGRGVDVDGLAARTEREVWAVGALCNRPTSAPSGVDAPAASQQQQREQEQRRCKESWWRERFALDDAVRDVTLCMESSMGAARLLLLGRPSAPLGRRLQTLATDLAATCVRLRGFSRCPPLASLEAATLHVFAGAPHLAVAADGASALSCATSVTCLYGSCGPTEACATCTRTVKRVQRRLLESIVSLGQQMSAAASTAARSLEATPTPPAAAAAAATTSALEEELWLGLLLDTDVQAAVEAAVPAVLEAFREAAPGACSTHLGTPSTDSAAATRHRHVDLLLLPREHVCLVLDSELHALPWEGMTVCQERSISRLPYRSYTPPPPPPRTAASAASCSPAASVRRVVVHRDLEARQTASALDAVLARHPEWEVTYGETMHAAAAAATALTTDGSGDFAEPTPLMRRLLTGDTAIDAHIDTYVYAGHKGGEHLVPRGALCDWLPAHGGASAALVLLMGCSSARMSGGVLYDSFGLPYAYLSAGALCVLGCLWDVTDAEIDRLTGRFLELVERAATTTVGTPGTTGECLAVARRACKLRYLTAAATVCYGVNCRVGQHPC